MTETDKKSVLAVCNTPFQLICVVWLRVCFYKDARFDVIITDQIRDVEPIAKRAKESGVFDCVTLVRDNDYSYWHGKGNRRLNTKWDNARDYLTRTARRRSLYKGETLYDEFLIFNHSRFSMLLFEKLWQRNPLIEVGIYEEGIGCYDHISRCYYDPKRLFEERNPRRVKLDKVFRRSCLTNSIRRMYVFIPEMLDFHPPIDIVRIPPIDGNNASLTDALFAIFDCQNAVVTCEQDVILFEESYASDGWKFDYQQVLDMLGKAYGKENIIVKQHPRSTLNVFRDGGYTVFPGSNVPWEVLLLKNPALVDKLWVSYASGSMLCPYFYLNLPVRAVSMIKLVPQPLTDVHLGYLDHIRNDLFALAPDHYLLPTSEGELTRVDELLKEASAAPRTEKGKKPKLSIVFCVYNGAKIMRPAMESVLTQDFTDFELLCVDDGSTDETLAVFHEYAKNDKRVVVIPQEKNTGLFIARCNGINHAAGDYLLFLDADDSYRKDALREINEMTHFYHADVFHYAVEVVSEVPGEEAHIETTRVFHSPMLQKPAGKNLLKHCFCENRISRSMWSKAFKRDVIQKAVADVDDTRVDFGDDAYLMFRILYYANTYIGDTSGKAYYTYAFSPDLYIADKLTEKQFAKYANTWGRVSVKCREFLEKNHALETYREEWDALSLEVLLKPTLFFLLYRLTDEQRGVGFDIMRQYWDVNVLLRELKRLVDGEKFRRAKAEKTIGFRAQRKIKKIGKAVLHHLHLR